MQILDHCATKFLKTKQGTKITFITDTPFDVGGTEDLGIVVWFSREDVAKFLKKKEENVS